ncbi:hypothetical protein PIB30_114202, partial [Stylosanthes scabra]|nr:hypothetical protein [Stylosanthes scabra]
MSVRGCKRITRYHQPKTSLKAPQYPLTTSSTIPKDGVVTNSLVGIPLSSSNKLNRINPTRTANHRILITQ